MSRGPGKIQRTIRALFESEPDTAFTIADICMRIYPGINRPEKKHRVAVLRALPGATKGLLEWAFLYGESQGNTQVFFNQTSVPSYAMARMKADFCFQYPHASSEAELRKRLEPGGNEHKYIVPGGAWWQHVQQYRAELAEDTERAADLHRQSQREAAAIMAGLK